MKLKITFLFITINSLIVQGQITQLPYSESFETDWGVWQSSNSSLKRHSGTTPTPSTGPKGASDGLFYLYTEINHSTSDTALLTAECDFTNIPKPQLSFDYFFFGKNIGYLAIDVFKNSWQTLAVISNQQHFSDNENWSDLNVDLSNYGNKTNIIIRFRFVWGLDSLADMAIDNLKLESLIPCQKIDIQIDTSNTIPLPHNYFIDICPYTEIQLSAKALFPENNTHYTQDIDNTTFTWNLGNETTKTGRTISYTYPKNSGYKVEVTAKDAIGCINTNTIDLRVRVSDFKINHTNNQNICENDSIFLSAGTSNFNEIQYTETAFLEDNIGVISDSTFLPDGTGVSYFNTIHLTDYPAGSIIRDSTDIINVRMTIEHSYAGDIDIELICPNGQSSILKNNAGGDTFLGEPIDFDASDDYGKGYTYYWQNNAEFQTMTQEALLYYFSYTDRLGNQVLKQAYLPAGNYTPYQSFDNLSGCPLNGDWTIKITDHLALDNGYIFDWTLKVHPELNPNLWKYNVPIKKINWQIDSISSPTDSSVIFYPEAGKHEIKCRLIDSFGCSYDTSIQVIVNELPQINLGKDTSFCFDDSVMLDGGFSMKKYCWNTNSQERLLWIKTPGIYSVTITDLHQCINYDSVKLKRIEQVTVNLPTDTLFCSNKEKKIDAVCQNATQYIWNTGDTIQQISPSKAGYYTITACNRCHFLSHTIHVHFNYLPYVDLGEDATYCAGDTFLLHAGWSGDVCKWQNGLQNRIFLGNEPGVYYCELSNSCGSSYDTIEISYYQPLSVNIGNDTTICNQDQIRLDAGNNFEKYLWSDNSTNQSIEVGSQNSYYVDAFKHGCKVSDTIFVSIKECYSKLIVPNVFTPNGDGINDYFKINEQNILHFELKIYNRWGKTLFRSQNVENIWDGTHNGQKCATGVYFWSIQFQGLDIGGQKRGFLHLYR